MSQPKSLTYDLRAAPLVRWVVLAEIALVFAVFFLHGAWPTPDVNENGYLAKAAHFWNHEAFAKDFFCNTADAHVVYYFAFGWLTTLGWSLDTVAWIGRILTWLLLAIAWRGLSYAIVRQPWVAVLSAELFVLLTEQASMAGEWIIGGVEAKGFAWALVLWAIHALICQRWNVAWLLVGLATSFHVVVGGWAEVCLAIVWLTTERSGNSLVAMLPGLIGGFLLALPGLWFASQLNHGVDGQLISQANAIQVFERIPHHLYPLAFQAGYVSRHLLLWAMFFLLCSLISVVRGVWRLQVFVFAVMGLAAVGFVLAWIASLGQTSVSGTEFTANFAANLLRFYWFRLSDIILPLGVTLLGLQYVCSLLADGRRAGRWLLAGMLIVSGYDLYNQARHLPWLPQSWGPVTSRSDKFMDYDDWRDVCHWVAANTPADAVFITPRNSNTFKWYTGRSEVATWKDMPQDAKSIVEWWSRINNLFATGNSNPAFRWRSSVAELDLARVLQLAAQYGAQYAIVDFEPDAALLQHAPVYMNHSYAIIRLATH